MGHQGQEGSESAEQGLAREAPALGAEVDQAESQKRMIQIVSERQVNSSALPPIRSKPALVLESKSVKFEPACMIEDCGDKLFGVAAISDP